MSFSESEGHEGKFFGCVIKGLPFSGRVYSMEVDYIMNKIQPVNGFVLIRIDGKKERKTDSGLIIPDTVEERRAEGTIEAIASDAPKTLAVGDRVIYKESSGIEVKHEDVLYILINAEDIVAKFAEVDKI